MSGSSSTQSTHGNNYISPKVPFQKIEIIFHFNENAGYTWAMSQIRSFLLNTGNQGLCTQNNNYYLIHSGASLLGQSS